MTASQSPIADVLRSLGAHMEPYGELGIGIVQAFGAIELEYAAIRKGSGLFDEPQRAVVEVRGGDRLEFLNRMLTQELRGMQPGSVRESFWLNRKGRIDADVRVIELGDRTLLEVDAHARDRTVESLSAYVFSEDVAIERADGLHRFTLHGPGSGASLARAMGLESDAFAAMTAGRGEVVAFEGERPVVLGDTLTGERSIGVIAREGTMRRIVDRLLEDGSGVSPIGWQAVNIARIENGQPMYLIDYGTNSLPAETGVLESRVSFTKGCYLGQEVVARMRSLGHPKQVVVGLRIRPGDGGGGIPDLAGLIPDAGTALYAMDGSDRPREVGAITSATLSPMLGRAPIAFASVRWGHHEAGKELSLTIDGRPAIAVVQTTLAFWRA